MPRERDLIWEAVVAAFWEPANSAERGKFNKAVKLLKESGAKPEQVSGAVATYAQKLPNAICTPLAVASNWGMLNVKRQSQDTREYEEKRSRAREESNAKRLTMKCAIWDCTPEQVSAALEAAESMEKGLTKGFRDSKNIGWWSDRLLVTVYGILYRRVIGVA